MARWWATRAELDEGTGRYHVRGKGLKGNIFLKELEVGRGVANTQTITPNHDMPGSNPHNAVL